MKSIAVFCGSSLGNNDIYAQAAEQLGIVLAETGKRLIYGGGKVGLMGLIADTALRNNGEVTGILPRFLEAKEVGHTGLTELLLVDTMHERKKKMSELADGFIAMPGGFGTLDELAEILTWIQLGLIKKPIALLNVNEYFNALNQQLDHMVYEGFLRKENRDLLLTGDDAAQLLRDMENLVLPDTEKWLFSEGI